MNCETVKKLIPLYLDNALKADEIKLIRQHLEECAACKKEVLLFEKSWQMLGEVDEIEPSADYISRFWTKVSLDQSWQKRLYENIRKTLVLPRLVPAYAAICILVLVGLFSWNRYQNVQETQNMLLSMDESEMEMMDDMELAEDFEVINDIGFYEDYDVIKNLDSLES